MEILHIKLIQRVLSGLLLAIAVPCAAHTQSIADALQQEHMFDAGKNDLYLNNKQIDSWDGVEQIVERYPQVRNLYLNGNRLQSPSGAVFRELAKLPSLRGLQLENNQLEEFPTGISKLPLIRVVCLMGNMITRVPSRNELGFPKSDYISIYLEDNPLREKPDEFLNRFY